MLTFPNAKINIGLNITAKRNDGYHNLETVFYPIGIQDVLEIKPLENSDKDWDFQIAGQQVTERPEDNLVIKVFKDLQKEFDLPAVDIYLQKKIPTGAGLGGGSSDAAFTMKTLNEMFELHLSTADMERRSLWRRLRVFYKKHLFVCHGDRRQAATDRPLIERL